MRFNWLPISVIFPKRFSKPYFRYLTQLLLKLLFFLLNWFLCTINRIILPLLIAACYLLPLKPFSSTSLITPDRHACHPQPSRDPITLFPRRRDTTWRSTATGIDIANEDLGVEGEELFELVNQWYSYWVLYVVGNLGLHPRDEIIGILAIQVCSENADLDKWSYFLCHVCFHFRSHHMINL